MIRRGLSLLEMTIVIAVLAAAAAMAMESLLGARRYEDLGAQQDELHADAERVLSIIHDDLSMSGWHLPGGGSLPSGSSTFAADRASLYYPYVLQPDGSSATGGYGSLFPPRPADHPANLVHRPVGPMSDLPLGLPGDPADLELKPSQAGYATSYYARSQELVFLRSYFAPEGVTSATSGWIAPPPPGGIATLPRLPVLNFGSSNGPASSAALWRTAPASASGTVDMYDILPVKRPSQFKITNSGQIVSQNAGTADEGRPYGVFLDGGWLDLVDNKPVLRPLWDTMDPDDLYLDLGVGNPNNSTNEQDPAALREYIYAVVPVPPSSGGGAGRLVRAMLVPNGSAYAAGVEVGQRISGVLARARLDGTGISCAWVVQEVLSDNVARVLFTTRRHDAALSPAQIRVQLFLARRTRDRATNGHFALMISQVITMRTRLSADDLASDADLIGTPSVPFSY